MKKDYLIIIPTYNELENIEAILRKILSISPSFHVLVVDDGSPDGTGDIVDSLCEEFHERLYLIRRTGKQGLGTAYLTGFRFALEMGYQYIFETDADFSHNPEDLPRLLDACEHGGADLAIGSRYCSGVNVVNWPMQRVLMSFFAGKYVQLVTGMPIKDPTAGFKCYRRSVLETIPLDKVKFLGYAFQIEMKFLTWKYGFRIQEVPIIFTDRTKGESKMSPRIFREAFFGVISMKIGSWFKNYRKPLT